MTTMLREPHIRTDEDRSIFVEDHRLAENQLHDDTLVEYERERYDEQILAGLITF